MNDWREGWARNDQCFFCTFILNRAIIRQCRVVDFYKSNDGLVLVTNTLSFPKVGASCCGKTAKEAIAVACEKLRELETPE